MALSRRQISGSAQMQPRAAAVGRPGVVAVVVGVLALLGAAAVLAQPGRAAAPAAPPAVDVTHPHLAVVPAVVPPSGGVVALVGTNPTGEDAAVHGVGGTVQVWSDGTWKPWSSFVAGFDPGAGAGTLGGGEVVVPAIGLGTPAHAFGRVEWLHVGALRPGFYRLAHDSVAGVLEVRAGAPQPPAPEQVVRLLCTARPQGVDPSGPCG
jgi:hypothetical protein